jgi:polysaccharide pyruvyl transferase WcaK-like protein
MKILHMSIYNRNIGDNALNYVIDEIFNKFGEYTTKDIFQKVFTDEDIPELNSYDLIVVGGGGYLTTHNCIKNKPMKWGSIFRIPNDILKKINTKMVFYGWGFNHFYNDPELSVKGKEFLNICKEKNWIFSVRNDESKYRLKSILSKDMHNYIIEIPDSGCLFEIPDQDVNNNLMGFNVALDRPELRYGSVDNAKNSLVFIHDLVKSLGFEISYILHTPPDTKLLTEFKKNVNIISLNNLYKNTVDSWSEYKKCKRIIATRGHGQIINSANNIPTFSIASHPKVEGFARSNNLDSYCWVYNKNNLKELEEKIIPFINGRKDSDFLQTMKVNKEQWKKQTNEFIQKVIDYAGIQTTK